MTKKEPKRFVILIEGIEPLTDSVGNVYTFKTSKDAQDFIDYEEIENAEVARRDIDFKDTNKYGKIAEWIISQDVATGIKSEDIKEIADFIFDMNLTPKEIKLVKDELLSRKYFNIKDAKDKKFRDNYYGNVPESILRKSKDFILKRLFRELDEEKAKPLSIDKENNITDIKSKITARVKEIKNVPNDIHDSKDNCKYIVYLNGEPYYTAHSEDEANRIESEIYSNVDEDFEKYYGPYPDVRIRKICDARVKDSKPEDIKDLYDEGLYVEDIHDILDRIYPEYKNTESLDEVPDRIWNKVYDILGDKLLKNYKENPNDVLTKAIELFNLKDSKVKDSNSELFNRIKARTKNFTESFSGNIVVDENELEEAKEILNKYYIDVDYLEIKPGDYPFVPHPSGKKITQYEIYGDTLKEKPVKDSKVKDNYSYALIKEDKYYDPEGLNIDENEKNILYVGGSKQECLIELEILHKEMKDKYSRDKDVSVSPITGSQFYVYFMNAISKEYYRVVEIHPNNIKDAKLTRKQKLWYGEELEKFIHPQYLRRNYQLKRIKRRKTK